MHLLLWLALWHPITQESKMKTTYTLFAITDAAGKEVFYSSTRVNPRKRACDIINGSLIETTNQYHTLLAAWIRGEYAAGRHVTHRVIGEYTSHEEMAVVRYNLIKSNSTCFNRGSTTSRQHAE